MHAVHRAALVWRGSTIRWAGAEADLPAEYQSGTSLDARGCLVIPGLIDCHTHLGFGGCRSNEFVERGLGSSYHDIQSAGGGILASVASTRAAPEEELFRRCENFLREIVQLGLSTV